MRQIVEFPLAAGGSILVEVDLSSSDERVVRASRAGEVVTKANETFEMAVDRIRPVADTVLEKLRSLASKPDELEVKFGFKLSSEAGAILASVGAEANFEVTLKWSRGADAPAGTG